MVNDGSKAQRRVSWADLKKSISRLPPAQREYLHRHLRDDTGHSSEHPLRRHNIREAPLSYSQQRLWFLDRLEQAQSTYHLVKIVRLQGILDVDALHRGLNTLVQRHETLRTTFEQRDDGPVQVINDYQPIALERPLFRGSTLEDAVQQASEEINRPFDLSAERLVRAVLFRLGGEEHLLLIIMHHIITDGWSMDLLFSELSSVYNAIQAQEAPELPPIPMQYSDYAIWQLEQRDNRLLEPQLGYWREQLAGELPTLDLPTDYQRPPIQTHEGAQEKHQLSEVLVRRLKELSDSERVTLFMTLLAAFNVLLARYSGQTDIIVGAPIAGRNRAELEGIVGCFINSIVLRTDLQGPLSFRDLLSRVRKVALQAYENQDASFEQLLEELNPERDLSRTPLFQVYFNMIVQSSLPLQLTGLKVERVERLSMDSKFDFTLYLIEQEGRVLLNLVYDRSLFTAKRMRTVLSQYRALLEQVVDEPDRDITQFSLLTEQSVAVLPNPACELGRDWLGPVHEKLTEHARRAPGHPAVRDMGFTWSYGELEARTNQLARCLRDQGIVPGDIVAIYAHRSASVVMSVLGVLKAGAAFLLLDSAYPPSRLTSYVEQARPRGFLSLEGAGPLPEKLAAACNTCRCHLFLSEDGKCSDVLGNYSESRYSVRVEADSLAYLTFTSGSSGKPKGVLGKHGSLSYFLPWQVEQFVLDSEDRFSMLSGLSHDPLQRDIFTALWVGGTICVPDINTIGTPGRLARWMAEEEVTFTHLTPAMSQVLTEAGDASRQVTSLRGAFFVGDRLSRHDVLRLSRLAPNVTCINSYGSAETQRAVGYYIIKLESEGHGFQERAIYPLGRGIPGAQLLILNRCGGLAGVGEMGEIYVRSHHIALGYLDEVEKTKQTFVTNPYTGYPGDKMYKTGDLGRYQPDGNVEFLGRTDYQVNIRGFRIELQEIEAVLREHRNVQKAVVVARNDRNGEAKLTAYVVHEEDYEAIRIELRHHVKEKLPEHMVPSSFVMLSQLPLTPNGKVDYDALPKPSPEDLAVEGTYQKPGNAIEQSLTCLWRELFRLEQVSVGDNFFDIGGHSLLAMQMISRVRDKFHVELPLIAVFDNPTLRELSDCIRVLQGDSEERYRN